MGFSEQAVHEDPGSRACSHPANLVGTPKPFEGIRFEYPSSSRSRSLDGKYATHACPRILPSEGTVTTPSEEQESDQE